METEHELGLVYPAIGLTEHCPLDVAPGAEYEACGFVSVRGCASGKYNLLRVKRPYVPSKRHMWSDAFGLGSSPRSTGNNQLRHC